ncbi:MAG: hypothetical protein M3680_26880 [Myxococcota bacterium]|nr:hypothetical protein [Myxococcota bacterium]
MTSAPSPARLASALVLALFAAACSNGGDDGPTPDAARPDGAVSMSLDPAACTGVAASVIQAAQVCGTPLPGTAQAQVETMCKKGIMGAQLCGGDPARGLACFESYDATDWVCAAGEPYPACNGDLAAALGMYCLLALGNPACASGIQCDFNADCSSGSSCNGATGQCFSKSAYCVGLPCQFNADCPTGETCNGAEGACIRE